MTLPKQEHLRILEHRALSLVNRERARHLGCYRLRWDETAAKTARRHSADQLRRRYFGHVAPDGTDLGDRLAEDGICFSRAGENVAFKTGISTLDRRDIDHLHRLLMKSPGHRDNILHKPFTHLGVGIAFDHDRLILTEVFLARQHTDDHRRPARTTRTHRRLRNARAPPSRIDGQRNGARTKQTAKNRKENPK